MSIVIRMSFNNLLSVCSISDLLYFTQVNKVPARLLGVCLGEDVAVLAGSTLAGPTIFLNYNMQSPWRPHKLLFPIAVCDSAHANGSLHGHHLHRP